MPASVSKGLRMQHATPRRRCRSIVYPRRGFTLIELMVVVAILSILFGLVVVVTSTVRKTMRGTECINNLRQIGVAFSLYANENKTFLPEPALSNKSWEQMLRPVYTGSYECPADAEIAPSLGSSYDWRDTGNARTSFAGKSLQSVGPPSAVLAFESLSGWHARGKINVVRLDGSAGSMPENECYQNLAGAFPRQ